jgi:hypothetical protein
MTVPPTPTTPAAPAVPMPDSPVDGLDGFTHRFADVGGTRLHAVVGGSGPAVLPRSATAPATWSPPWRRRPRPAGRPPTACGPRFVPLLVETAQALSDELRNVGPPVAVTHDGSR